MSNHLCRTRKNLRSGELAIPGDQWPIFLWEDLEYNPEDAWKGFLRNTLLVTVCTIFYNLITIAHDSPSRHLNTYLPHQVLSRRNLKQHVQVMHEFTAWPVYQPPLSLISLLRSGLVRFNSIDTFSSYIQVRFALSSSAVFSRTDTVTDSERFYTSLLEFLDSAEEKGSVDMLLIWWNR